MSSASQSNSGFATGFASAVLLLLGLVAGFRVVDWVAAHPTPDAVYAWLAAPRISITDLLFLVGLMVIGWAVLYTIAYGPRMR